MTSHSHIARTSGRAVGLGPWLMLAVTLMVLTSGGVSTARLIGSAGVGLALTVLPERAGQPTDSEPHGDVAVRARLRGADHRSPSVEAVAGVARAPTMARLGEIDLPPPTVS